VPTNDSPSPLNPPVNRVPSTAALLVALGATLALVLLGRFPTHARWAADLSNAAHSPAFALVTLILLALVRRIPSRRRHVLEDYALAIAGALTLGIAIELAQLVTGRDASLDDLLRDALGAFAATGFCAAFDPGVLALARPQAARAWGLTVGVASLLLVVAPLIVTAGAYLQRSRRFPELVDFSSPVSTYFLGVYSSVTAVRGKLPTEMQRAGQPGVGLHARLTGDHGWALALWEPPPDWRGYDRVNVEVANPTKEQLAFRLRVRDGSADGDRRRGVLGTIEVPPETRTTATLDLPRPQTGDGNLPVDLSDVRALVIVRSAANRAHEFYVVRILLE